MDTNGRRRPQESCARHFDAITHPQQLQRLAAGSQPRHSPAAMTWQGCSAPSGPRRPGDRLRLRACDRGLGYEAPRILTRRPGARSARDRRPAPGGDHVRDLRSWKATDRRDRPTNRSRAAGDGPPFRYCCRNPERSDRCTRRRSSRSLGAQLPCPDLARLSSNPFQPGALQPVRDRLDELLEATAALRNGRDWTLRVHGLAQSGDLSTHGDVLSAFAMAWHGLWESLVISEADFQEWRGDRTLLGATDAVSETWRRQVDFERLLPLQNWCTLVRKLEPLREAGLDARASSC